VDLITPCKDLVCRFLYLEVYHARRGDSDSMSYLLSIDAEDWAVMVGMDRVDWNEKMARLMKEWERNRA